MERGSESGFQEDAQQGRESVGIRAWGEHLAAAFMLQAFPGSFDSAPIVVVQEK